MSIYHISKKLSNFLKNIPVHDVLKHKKATSFKPLVSFDEGTRLDIVLKQLKSEQILSCPIFKLQDNEKMYIGIISVFDILSYAIFEEIFDSQQEFSQANLFDFINRIDSDDFFATPVGKLIGASKESANPWILYSTDSIADLVHIFTASKQHRALVIDSDILIASLVGPIPPTASLSILSQSDLIRYLVDSSRGHTLLKSELVEPLLDISITDVEKYTKKPNVPVYAMLDTQSALHGFRTMYLDQVQAIPVIDKQGNVVCNLSASDLLGITVKNLNNLSLPVFEYLETMKRPGIKADQIRNIGTNSSIGKAIELFVRDRINHVWITRGESEKLIGAMSLTDVIRFLEPIHIE
jgi:CBS-domain-containing membrane protein